MSIPEEYKKRVLNAITLKNIDFMEIIVTALNDYEECFSDGDIQILTDKTLSRELLKQDYPVLLEIDPQKDKMDQIHLSGNYRYYANKSCTVKGKKYYYTSQLYGLGTKSSHGDNRTPLWKWVCEKLGIDPNDSPDVGSVNIKRVEDSKLKLKAIKKYINSQGYIYSVDIIDNFYLSIKTKPFVILAGTSGTGKTRLVRLFAEAIGAFANGRYKQIAVKPDWSDSTDLFGHVNLENKFVPGAIVEFIKKAADDSNKLPYILCLDEMNLARVEYYFSDFLSVIETRDKKGDEIITDKLIPKSCYSGDNTAEGLYSDLMIPENLYIVGTVNMDETTFPFSKKVLDRANTIEFSQVNFDLPDAHDTEDVEPVKVENDFLRSKYLKLRTDCIDRWEDVKKINDKIKEINTILAKGDAHFGYRMRDEIIFYMLYNEEFRLLPKEEAFDNQIMQKVLPRIQGSSESTANLLRELFKLCAGPYTSKNDKSDARKMEAYLADGGTANYPKSAKKICMMLRRYEDDDFTSFWV